MRILVIAANQEKFPYPVIPIGAAIVAQELKENGHYVNLFDLMFVQNPEKIVIKKIEAFKPEIVCISIRNLDNQILVAPVFYLKKIKQIINIIRKATQSRIIVGGTGFTAEPEQVFKYLKPDFGIKGEAYHSLSRLIFNFSDRTVPGLVWRNSDTGQIKINPQNSIPYSGARQDNAIINFISIRRYIRQGSKIGLQTKKGCSRECSYCDNFKMTSSKCYSLDINIIIQQIKNIIENTGFKYFFFLDEIFSDNLVQTKQFLKNIISQKINIKFEITDAPLNMDDEYVYLLKQAGCQGVMFGLDAGSDKMLKNYNKQFLKKDILKTIQIFNKYKLPYYITALFGGPGEDIFTLKESINFFYKLPKVSAVLINYGIRLLSLTEITRYAENLGLLKKTDLLKPVFFLSKGFTKREWNIIMEACRKNNGWAVFNKIDSLLISGTLKTVKNLLPAPQWKYAGIMSIFLKSIRKILSLFIHEYNYTDINKNIIRD
jgi:radical SAM superfamily enzyme YgiQ (UPF0313 family)